MRTFFKKRYKRQQKQCSFSDSPYNNSRIIDWTYCTKSNQGFASQVRREKGKIKKIYTSGREISRAGLEGY